MISVSTWFNKGESKMRFWYSMDIKTRNYVVGIDNNIILTTFGNSIDDWSLAQRVCASLNDIDADREKEGKPLHEYYINSMPAIKAVRINRNHNGVNVS
jgi:hypothetical protein